MSIGYRKEGYSTIFQSSKGGNIIQNIAFGILPIGLNLPIGYGRFYIPKDSPLISVARVDLTTLNSGERLTIEIKMEDGQTYKTVTSGYISRRENRIHIEFGNSNVDSHYANFFDINFVLINYSNSNYFKYLTNSVIQDGVPSFLIEEDYFGGVRINFAEVVVEGFPYGDGESTSQGGQGEMTDTSDPIAIDSKPLLTSGEFLRVYKTNATGLTALKEKLISNGFLDGLIPKLRTDATDYLLGLNAIPLASTDVASDTIKIANLDTEIASEYLTWYIADLDCGEIDIKEYFQTFMDYSPYTKLSIYLPYCATIPLNIDMFQNDKIKLKYRVDFLTGYCLAIISNSEGVVTTVTGNCAYNLPIRSNDYNNVVSRGLAVVGGIVGTAGALATGNVPLAVGTAGATLAGGLSLGNAMEKPNVFSNGSLGGNYGILGNRTPYLIIQRPSISVPSDYGKTIGYMSRITAKLGDLTGFTVVEEIHLEHISATDDEKRLIENALKSGVIL